MQNAVLSQRARDLPKSHRSAFAHAVLHRQTVNISARGKNNFDSVQGCEEHAR